MLVRVFSEGFIEVSEDEFKEEDADDSLVVMRGTSPAEVQKDGTKKEEKPEEILTPAAVVRLKEEEEKLRQNEETELKEEPESSSAPAINEWEHMDIVSISVGMKQSRS